jgi:FixJ family two-component response regulator
VTAEEFLRSKPPNGPSCLVLDVRLPGVNGLDLQRELADAGVRTPIVFLTGQGDIPMSVKAMKSGAVEFLTKPFEDQDAGCDPLGMGTRPSDAPRAE